VIISDYWALWDDDQDDDQILAASSSSISTGGNSKNSRIASATAFLPGTPAL
jgi:hypothetical protein